MLEMYNPSVSSIYGLANLNSSTLQNIFTLLSFISILWMFSSVFLSTSEILIGRDRPDLTVGAGARPLNWTYGHHAPWDPCVSGSCRNNKSNIQPLTELICWNLQMKGYNNDKIPQEYMLTTVQGALYSPAGILKTGNFISAMVYKEDL